MRHRNSPLDYQVQQTYNIGLILLEICTFLHSPQNLYPNLSLHPIQVNQYLQNISHNYSELLCTLIGVMLSSFSDRPLPSQIYQIFSPFKQ